MRVPLGEDKSPSSLGSQSDANLQNPSSDESLVIGRPQNVWLYSDQNGFDLTRPEPPYSTKVYPRMTMQTSTDPIIIAPSKSALVIVDMQNFFLSEAMGKGDSDGRRAEAALLKYAIPAARLSGIRVVWVNWGITDDQFDGIPPSLWRNFGYASDGGGKTRKLPAGIGDPLGTVKLRDGKWVYLGKKLMRDQWNTRLHGPLDEVYRDSLKGASLPDVLFHKNRISGLWGANNECEAFLREQGITTLLFGGVNTDQCVFGTLQDGFTKGFDTVLLKDGCATSSPEFASSMVEFNCEKVMGFVSTTESLFEAARNIRRGEEMKQT